MTFRIFSDDARKAIADHIIGAPPAIPNRYGANQGTDLIVQGGNVQPPTYNVRVTGLYLPGGSYEPGGPSSVDTPPTHTPGQTAQIPCSGGVPADNAGNCPQGMQNKNGKLFAFNKQVDANGLAFCCPAEVPTLNQPQQNPPQTKGVRSCPPGFINKEITFKQSEENTPLQKPPYFGLTPNQWIQRESKTIQMAGGTAFKVLDLQKSVGGGNVFTFTGCLPRLTSVGTVVPPTRTPTPPPTETKEYDGDDKNSTPDQPHVSDIILRGRPIADIAGGRRGFCQLDPNLQFLGSDCKKLSPNPITTSKSTDGLAADCSKAKSAESMFFALNPGPSTIEKGTQIVAVRDAVGVQGTVTAATIVVVPCST